MTEALKEIKVKVPWKVKHHFLECELKTADDLIDEYVRCFLDGPEGGEATSRQKLIWLLERLQESVL